MSGSRRFVRKGDILPRLGQASTDSNRSTLLLALHPEPCAPCSAYVSEIEAIAPGLQEWATRMVSMAPGEQDRRRLGLLEDEAAVVLADRWGEVFEAATVDADHDFPLPRQLIESAKILDLSCGECNVPGQEWLAVDT